MTFNLSNPLTRYPVNARTYRRIEDRWEFLEQDQKKRQLDFTLRMGEYTQEQEELVSDFFNKEISNTSGRVWWAAGSNKENDPFGYYAFYNCSGTMFVSFYDFIRSFNNLFLGCGQGEVIREVNLKKLPKVVNVFNLEFTGYFGEYGFDNPSYTEHTKLYLSEDQSLITIEVGDSREGWASATNALFELYTNGAYFLEDKDKLGIPLRTNVTKEKLQHTLLNGYTVHVCLSSIRPYGTPCKGFGGIANPVYTEEFFTRLTNILNRVALTESQQIDTLDCALINNEFAAWAVAGGQRRSAKIEQFDFDDPTADAKMNLWTQLDDGTWVADEEKKSLKFSNFTKLYFHKPTLEEVENAVRTQFICGEGAIQYVPVALARANVDLFENEDVIAKVNDAVDNQISFEELFSTAYKDKFGKEIDEQELTHRVSRYQLNPCFAPGTIVMTREGYFPIETLVGKEVEVHDGTEWRKVDNFRVTATDQDVYDVELHDGSIITATAYHKFILVDGTEKQLKDLEVGDELMTTDIPPVEGTIKAKGAYLKGFLIGDGTSSKGKGAMCKIYAPKMVCLDRLLVSQKEIGLICERRANGSMVGELGLTPSDRLKSLTAVEEDLNPWCYKYKHEFPYEVLNWDNESKANFIAGLFDADGTAQDNAKGFGYQLTSISRPFLEGLVLLLRTLGINSKIGPARKGGVRDFGPERGGLCNCKDTYRISLSQKDSIKLGQLCTFERLKNLGNKVTISTFRNKANKVKAVSFSHNAPEVYCCTVTKTHKVSIHAGLLTGQCGEVEGSDFMCNLSSTHLRPLIREFIVNELDAIELDLLMSKSFYASALIMTPLLKHKFPDEKFAYSREVDPIVLASFTEGFEFFSWLFGPKWCEWWLAAPSGYESDDVTCPPELYGRPDTWIQKHCDFTEEELARISFVTDVVDHILWRRYEIRDMGFSKDDSVYSFLANTSEELDLGKMFTMYERIILTSWKLAVRDGVFDYCDEQGLKRPNRYSGLKPEGSQTLLTGYTNSWEPPKAAYYIRRITMDPATAVAKACYDFGYEVVPGQTDTDENGVLLNDPFDPRVKTWLVEIPIHVDTVPDWFDGSEVSALAQYKFWMQCQTYYTTHNTSSTILLKENEVETLAAQIYADIHNDKPYISTALLSRMGDTFPRLPYEKCTKEEYERRMSKIDTSIDFYKLVAKYDSAKDSFSGPSGCDSDFCEIKF